MESAESKPKASRVLSGMGMKVAIVAILILAVGATVYTKNRKSSDLAPENAATAQQSVSDKPLSEAAPQSAAPDTKAGLPRLVDLGATKCIPCKMMAPILEDLKKTYAGKLEVVFIDVWEKPDEAKKYGINLIPTQVFYDASGQERFRHEGFYSKEDILAKWKELGVTL
ncbi:MAG TPA: thioredoxin family protein [Candidatus Hydrogenedentes bacterium]|nr:thioredoxin family protein [Candidatus Hydrogenedentota bacterium]HPC16107.1 thioredoxin family protein [Candidatus Hydrogenedentota bacterium]HRT18865.1 thioredoxin family protein [Candidatus Hydrogenedentota bacterium]HRT65590.1 thioredoxin family protein [Candidatus Hydrogenedentota bacterium]